ncbi:MAG TPA: TetR/AcrR family transcriptional regulator [Acidimicrobiales bacterium]|nr:TetR/AcrR family transcriptional regulator [Acidimicrobiales bacterium]
MASDAASGPSAAPSRREMILEAAAQLFFDRGFAATGIDDIGTAVGVTGPAFYRHFKSKHDLLVALVERAVERLQSVVDRALDEADGDAERALQLMAEFGAAACVDDGPLTAIYTQEARDLQPDERTRLNRLHRRMRDAWVRTLGELRPHLSEDELRLAIHAISGLQTSVATYHGDLPPERQREVLARMTLSALHWEDPA